MALLFFDGFDGIRNGAGNQTPLGLSLRRYDEMPQNSAYVDSRLADFVIPVNPNGVWGGSGGGIANNSVMYGKYFTAVTQIFIGFRYLYGEISDNINDATSEYAVIQIRDSTNVTHLTVTLTPTTGVLRVRRGTHTGTLLASSSSNAFTTKKWQYLEFSAVANNSTGTVELKVDGSTVISASGIDTVNGGNENYARLYLMYGYNPHVMGFDDVYVCDSSGGSPYNTYLGNVRVLELLPDASGDSTQWTPNTGTNWDANNDSNRDDADTTYVSSSTAGNTDLYNLQTIDSSASTIYALKTTVVARKSDVGTQNIQLVTKTGSTTQESSSQSLTNDYVEFSETFLQNPDTTANWTTSEINSIQVGFKIPDA
jgi:hypothetical protein